MESSPRSLPFRACVAVLAVLALVGSARAEDRPLWIVVTAPAFDDVVAPLCRHRAAQGHEVVHIRFAEGVAKEAGPARQAVALHAEIVRRCAGKGAASCVLLVGAVAPGQGPDAARHVLPAFAGTVGRMTDLPTDVPYGDLDDDGVPDLPVGRFPARTVAEAQGMVQKTIAFEEQRGVLPWRRRITLLVGHPGGSSALERKLAAGVVTRAVASGFARTNARWRIRAVLHMDTSPFTVPDDALRPTSLRYLQDGQLLSIYLGHSGASGLASASARFLTREDWATLDLGAGAGILMTCGCWACHVGEPRGEGYGLAAMRNPRGPVAVVGSYGESYGAMGKLAFEGLLPILAAEAPTLRLGDWWMAIQGGLARGKIGQFEFMLYDRADGSGGEVPLEVQRREHLQMWTLQGDPALRLPPAAPAWDGVEIEGEAKPGATLVVRGPLPEGFGSETTTVEARVERPFGVMPGDLPALPEAKGEAWDAAALRRHAAANDVVVVAEVAKVADGSFVVRCTLPADLPGDEIHVRVRAAGGEGEAEVVRVLPIPK